MIEISKYDIYGTIDHEYKGKNVRLVGKVLEINEGDRTCKMQFENNLCEDGIPMESVSIDEGVFDKIKDSFGSGLSDIKNSVKNITKYAKNVFRKVGGLVRTVYHGKILPVLNNVMMGQYAAAGALNKDITLYLPQETKEIAKVNDVVVKDQYGINYDYQLKEQNEFLKTVIEKYKKSFPEQSKPTMEGLKTVYLNEVNERYGIKEQQRLIESRQLDNFFISRNTHPSILKKMGEALNESNKINNKIFEAEYSEDENPGLSASASEHTPLWNVKQITSELIKQLSSAFKVGGFSDETSFDEELQNILRETNMSQEDYDNLPKDKKVKFDNFVKSSIKGISKRNSPETVHPLLIWGAPGIGKTQITQQCIGLFNHEYGIDCMMCDVPLQSMTKESFALPGIGIDPSTGEANSARMIPFDTIPFYRHYYQTGEEEKNEIGNKASNAHMFVQDYLKLDAEAKKNLKDGGIIFFDELISASTEVLDIVMKLLDERKLGSDFILGSHWIMAGASNRAYDMKGHRTHWEPRYGRRFQQVTFVPVLSDWLMWAKGYNINIKTGNFDKENQGEPRIEQTIIDFLSSVGKDAWYEIIKDAQDIEPEKAAKMTATPASWKFASDAMYKEAVHKMHQSGMSDEDIRKYVQRHVYNPETGEWELHYNGLTDAERADVVGLNIGSPSEPLTKYKNFLNFSYYFSPTLLNNIWKYGFPYPKNPKIIIPLNLDPHTGGREDMINLLTAHLFAHNIIPIKLTKENLMAYDTFTKNDIKKYIEFFKHTGSVIKYLHTYLNACPNTPPISYEQAAKVVSDFTSGIMSVTGDPTEKQSYKSYNILDIYNSINNIHVAEKLKFSPSQVEEIRYSIWDIIKESNMLEYNMTLQQWGKQYHANSEEELKPIVINQMKNHLDKYNTVIFNDI